MILLEKIDQKRKLTIAFWVILVLLISWSSLIDSLSKEYINASTLQALAAYGFARAINSAVSLASSISFSTSFVVGFDIQPFQVLDPLNDLVEQYSSAMKLSISSLIIQKIVTEGLSTLFFKVGLTLLGIIFIASLYIRDGAYSFFLFRFFAFFTLIRFLIVMIVFMNGMVEQAFIDKEISTNMQEVEGATTQLEQKTNSENELSADERQGLITMREDYTNERSQLTEQIDTLEEELLSSKNNLIPLESKINELEEEMGTIEKLNVFSREDEYIQANSERDRAIAQKEKIQNDLEDLKRERDNVENNIQKTTDIIDGKNVSEGWMTNTKDKISEFRDMARWERIVTTVEDTIPYLLNLMAAFLLKTLIMPLVFLALFLKGFKYIWNIDPRTWIKGEYKKVKDADN